MTEQKDRFLSPIELYMQNCVKWLILSLTLCAFCASTTYTVLKICGLFPGVSLVALIFFDVFDVLCFIGGQCLSRKSIGPDGIFRQRYLGKVKVFTWLVAVIQWNYITYMIPSHDFWAYAPLFAVFSVFFLDHKYTFYTEVGIAASLALSWVLLSDDVAPVRDEHYVINLILRIILVVLVFLFFWLLSYFAQNFLAKPMEKIADYDMLTGLRNRRTMYALIHQTLEKNRAAGRSLTVLLCDIDDFKVTNDTYGHDCGDAVLRSVAKTMEETLADVGVAFRFGGEEFIVMVDAEPRAALEVAEKLRLSVAEKRVSFGGHKIAVTVTVGAVASDDKRSVDDLISTADDRMYLGKLSGKNRVVSTDKTANEHWREQL